MRAKPFFAIFDTKVQKSLFQSTFWWSFMSHKNRSALLHRASVGF